MRVKLHEQPECSRELCWLALLHWLCKSHRGRDVALHICYHRANALCTLCQWWDTSAMDWKRNWRRLIVLCFLPWLSRRAVIFLWYLWFRSGILFFAWCSWERRWEENSKSKVMGRTSLYPKKVKVQDSSCFTQLQTLLLLPYLTCPKNHIALCCFMCLCWQVPLTDFTRLLSVPSVLHSSIIAPQGLSRMDEEFVWTGTEWELSTFHSKGMRG